MGTIRQGLTTRSPWRLFLWHLIGLTTLVFLFPQNGEAILIPSPLPAVVPADSAARSTDLATIRSFLERKLVRQRLQDLGLTAEEIQSRLARMTDDQVRQVAGQLDSLVPGGDAGAVIIVILLLGIILFLILHFTGRKVVITK